jgi:hypothetical protein
MMKDAKKPEEQKDYAVVAFARMNPPHKGHLKLINRVKELAHHHGADHFIFLSPSCDPDKNPLKHSDKVSFLEKLAPGTNVYKPQNVKNAYEMLDHLKKSGYKKVTLVAGQDRYHEMNNLLKRYNDGGKFERVNVSTAGDRDPDNEGVEGISASKMRSAAKTGDFKSFRKGLGGHKSAKIIYQATRRGMK